MKKYGLTQLLIGELCHKVHYHNLEKVIIVIVIMIYKVNRGITIKQINYLMFKTNQIKSIINL